MTAPRPTELAITIAALPRVENHSFDGWLYADQVRHGLKLLGFECSAQQAAAWLHRMAEVECPWIERKCDHVWLYRVTAYGRTDIANKLPAIRVWT